SGCLWEMFANSLVDMAKECNLPGSDFTFLLAVASFYTGSGNFFCQWELYNWQWECLMHFIPNINLRPLSIWRKISLPELTSKQMILELADRSTTRPTGIAEDVFVKVGKFHFTTDFVVVDYVVDPRVPLILGRPFLRTRRDLIDVYDEELTLRIDDEAINFNIACEEYVQEVLGFYNNSKSSIPTPALDPIISSSSTSFTPFEGSDFILEEIETFLQTSDEISNLDDGYYDTEGDIHYLEKLLNEDSSPNLLPVKTED
nr:reverse transcriptase domain-containing protein [Tanacetum cinerariifolium]